MKISKTYKLGASLAVVGTIAIMALLTDKRSLEYRTTFLQEDDSKDPDTLKLFTDFVNQNNKNYLTLAEYDARYAVFVQNLQIINNHNDGEEGYSLEVNEFADMTPDEFE